MTTHKQDFVLRFVVRLAVQRADFVLETLPLRFFAVGVELCVCIVCAIDEPEVGGRLEKEKTLAIAEQQSYSCRNKLT